jgi:hypothetical protein
MRLRRIARRLAWCMPPLRIARLPWFTDQRRWFMDGLTPTALTDMVRMIAGADMIATSGMIRMVTTAAVDQHRTFFKQGAGTKVPAPFAFGS